MELSDLEKIEKVLADDLTGAPRTEALRLVRAEIWQKTRDLRAFDRTLVKKAEEEGRLTQSVPYIAKNCLTVRMKHPAELAKTGAELLSALKLKKDF